MEIRINDDFDLKKIVDSGQCFRPKEISSGVYRFVCGENILHLRELGEKIFEADCSAETWEIVWKNYFDLDTNYADIRRDIKNFAAGKTSAENVVRLESLIKRFGMMTRCAGLDADKLYNVTFRDKKTVGGVVNWVLMKNFGDVEISSDVPAQIVKKVFGRLCSGD